MSYKDDSESLKDLSQEKCLIKLTPPLRDFVTDARSFESYFCETNNPCSLVIYVPDFGGAYIPRHRNVSVKKV